MIKTYRHEKNNSQYTIGKNISSKIFVCRERYWEILLENLSRRLVPFLKHLYLGTSQGCATSQIKYWISF